MTAAFRRSQIPVRRKYASQFDVALSLGDLTLTIARSPVALDPTPFLKARIPNTTKVLPVLIHRAVSGHKSAIVMRLTGPSEAARFETRLALCYIATLCIFEISAPDLIHWGASNTLYTLRAFCRQSGAPDLRAAKPNPARPQPYGGWMSEGERDALQQALGDVQAAETSKRVARSQDEAADPDPHPLGPKPTLMSAALPLTLLLGLWDGMGLG